MTRLFLRASILFVGAPLVTVCLNCDALGPAGLAACPELSPNVDVLRASISADARADGKIKTFLQAAKDLAAVSTQAELEATTACQHMAYDLGVPPGATAAQDGPGGHASGACNAVAARIDGILRASGGAAVQVSVTPPTCQANMQAQAACSGACSGSVNPGEVVARCEPARLSGFCQGRCDGQCDGHCGGTCNGQCSARDAQGRCVGTCSGSCGGSCDATCHAHCSGSWQAPRCDASVTGPSADAECDASCRAHADVNASCTPPVVNVRAVANSPDAARLAATLQTNLPGLLHAEFTLGKRLLGDVQVVGQVGAQLPRLVGRAGVRALACVGAGADMAASASARVNVSVQASASVSGRVGAGS